MLRGCRYPVSILVLSLATAVSVPALATTILIYRHCQSFPANSFISASVTPVAAAISSIRRCIYLS